MTSVTRLHTTQSTYMIGLFLIYRIVRAREQCRCEILSPVHEAFKFILRLSFHYRVVRKRHSGE